MHKFKIYISTLEGDSHQYTVKPKILARKLFWQLGSFESNPPTIPPRKGWFSNTSFTTWLKTLLVFRPDALVFFRAKKTRASGRNVGKVFNPVVKLVLENQSFLMPEPAEKPSLQFLQGTVI